VLTLDELRARFEGVRVRRLSSSPAGSTGEPPITRWQKGGFLPAMPDGLEQLDMLLVHVPKPRKVLRDGIRLMGRRYVEPTLAAFVGEQVEAVYDPRDLTEIHVYHQGRFVCRALSSSTLGTRRCARSSAPGAARRSATSRCLPHGDLRWRPRGYGFPAHLPRAPALRR
jgi:putative transposase